ncbi:unnamed protein product [Ceratitis capitata]|uniref:(Mediterranean fruit fly) hypothetical protein n=1 Tax=Ceratitis capitata TaxID=7213 RepID=A0A811U957_CERCA|nr:unnamed protein product [Ceratitis capitata]
MNLFRNQLASYKNSFLMLAEDLNRSPDIHPLNHLDKDGYLSEAQLHNNNTGATNVSSTSSNLVHLNTTPIKSNNKKSSIAALSSSSPQLFNHRPNYVATHDNNEPIPPPIPPLPLNYQRSDDESNATETRDQKRQRAISKAVRQAELKRLRIAQEIQREQEEIEVQLRELEARGVLIEKALRGEGEQHTSKDARQFQLSIYIISCFEDNFISNFISKIQFYLKNPFEDETISKNSSLTTAKNSFKS